MPGALLWLAALSVAAGLMISGIGCSKHGYESARPLLERSNTPLEFIQVGEVARPALRMQVSSAPGVVRIGRVEPGIFNTEIAVEHADQTVTIHLSISGAPTDHACRLDWQPGVTRHWQPCRINIQEAGDAAVLQLRATGANGEGAGSTEGTPISMLLASPVLIAADAPRRPPVFILLIDALRADRLATFNPAIRVGSGLDRFAQDSVVFDNVRSTSSWTRTAVATLLTGLSADHHRVLSRTDVVAEEFDTLPEVLQRHGYQTAAWSANPNVLPLWGFGQGFDEFVDVGAFAWLRNKTDAAQLLDRVQAALQGNGDASSSWFYYVHLMDTHAPYVPDDRYVQQISMDPYLLATFPGNAPRVANQHAAEEYPKYLAEILQADEQIATFLEMLKERKLYDSALILVIADHGEEFLDHGDVYHGKTLYEEMLHVPAILKLPGNARARTHVTEAVSLTDFMPTVLDCLGLASPLVDGRPLLHHDTKPAPQVATLRLDGRYLTSIVEGPSKLIVDYGGRDHLFDLATDPNEQHDLMATRPQDAARLRTLMDAVIVRYRTGWHLRGCGNQAATRTEFTISAKPRPTSTLEPDDTIDPVNDGASGEFLVRMDLTPQRAKREVFGHLEERFIPDEDELLVDAASGPIKVAATGGGQLSYSFGLQHERSKASMLTLDTRLLTAAQVRPSDAVECDAVAGQAEKRDSYLRIWYVAPADTIADSKIDPAVAERLRALGYR